MRFSCKPRGITHLFREINVCHFLSVRLQAVSLHLQGFPSAVRQAQGSISHLAEPCVVRKGAAAPIGLAPGWIQTDGRQTWLRRPVSVAPCFQRARRVALPASLSARWQVIGLNDVDRASAPLRSLRCCSGASTEPLWARRPQPHAADPGSAALGVEGPKVSSKFLRRPEQFRSLKTQPRIAHGRADRHCARLGSSWSCPPSDDAE